MFSCSLPSGSVMVRSSFDSAVLPPTLSKWFYDLRLKLQEAGMAAPHWHRLKVNPLI
ncbi:MAG: hypothetical protein ACR5K7_01280 [Symbiopectobacterium sp.]